MTNSGTQPSNVNPDPTKWRDRIGEFCDSASSRGSIGAVVATISSVFAATAVAASVTGSIAPLAMVSAFSASTAAFSAAGAVLCAAAFGRGSSVRHSPLARKLGLVAPSLAALAAGIFTAHTIIAAPQPTAAPVSTAPDVIFNATAQDCKSERVKAAINKIKADGFSVVCAIDR